MVASFALAFFFVSAAAAYVPSLLVGLVGSVVLFAATVLGRFIPYFAGDFLGRDETPAHVVARDSAVPLPKPHTPKEPKTRGRSGRPGSSGAHDAAVRIRCRPAVSPRARPLPPVPVPPPASSRPVDAGACRLLRLPRSLGRRAARSGRRRRSVLRPRGLSRTGRTAG